MNEMTSEWSNKSYQVPWYLESNSGKIIRTPRVRRKSLIVQSIHIQYKSLCCYSLVPIHNQMYDVNGNCTIVLHERVQMDKRQWHKMKSGLNTISAKNTNSSTSNLHDFAFYWYSHNTIYTMEIVMKFWKKFLKFHTYICKLLLDDFFPRQTQTPSNNSLEEQLKQLLNRIWLLQIKDWWLSLWLLSI